MPSYRPTATSDSRPPALAVLALAILGMTSASSAASPTHEQQGRAVERQTGFRVRSDFSAGLNADQGWAGAVNENVTVNAEQPFRLRLEVERGPGRSEENWFRLQYRRNGGMWSNVDAQRFPMPNRELELNFEQTAVGETPVHWSVVQGQPAMMAVAADGQETFLRVETDQQAVWVIGRYETRWEPVELEAEFRLSGGAQSGTGLLFGYIDPQNHGRIHLNSSGNVRVSRFVGGKETAITEKTVPFTSGQSITVKVLLGLGEVTIELEGEAMDAVVFTAASGGAIPVGPLGFHVAGGSTVEFRKFALQGEVATPRVSIVASEAYEHGTATTDLLPGSRMPFRAGAGVSLSGLSPASAGDASHSEWEWPLVIRRYADGAVTNEDGDTFEFRLTDAGGHPLVADHLPTLTLALPRGLLAGTFVETPGRVGPWEAANGDLYFLMEPAETFNALMTVKSTDGGATWREVDGGNRPTTADLEGFASELWGDTLYMVHQTSDDVWLHSFRTSDHPAAPDTWAVRDELIASPEEPPTQVAAIAVRSDGSLVVVYGGPKKIHLKIRAPGGRWGDETVIDAEGTRGLSGPMVVTGADDVVHLAYHGNDGTAWYRRIQTDGTLTPREQLATGLGTEEGDAGSILPLVFLAETNTVVVIYRLATGQLWERCIINHTSPTAAVRVSAHRVVQNAVDSDQTGADAVAFGATVQVLFIEDESGRIFHTQRDATGTWQPATLQVDAIEGQWVRGTVLTRQAEGTALGYIYDAGSDGGSGLLRFGQLPLRPR